MFVTQLNLATYSLDSKWVVDSSSQSSRDISHKSLHYRLSGITGIHYAGEFIFIISTEFCMSYMVPCELSMVLYFNQTSQRKHKDFIISTWEKFDEIVMIVLFYHIW